MWSCPARAARADDFEVASHAEVGDEVRLEIDLIRFFAAATLFRGEARVGDRLVAKCRFTLALPR